MNGLPASFSLNFWPQWERKLKLHFQFLVMIHNSEGSEPGFRNPSCEKDLKCHIQSQSTSLQFLVQQKHQRHNLGVAKLFCIIAASHQLGKSW